MKTKEIWKDIPGYEGHYQVSNRGRVKSLKRKAQNGFVLRTVCERILKGSNNSDGYPTVRLYRDGFAKTIKVHRLVASVFIPNPECLDQVNHINTIKIDNRVKNLEWISDSDHRLHTQKHGLLRPCKGIKHGRSKLNEFDVLEIREKYNKGNCTMKSLAKRYSVTDSLICAIVMKKLWRHV